jgi:agmatine deiminase
VSEAPPPAAAGYRWPAEWEPHQATWLTWPHNPETWPNRLRGAEAAFVEMVRALAGREEVWINVADEAREARVRGQLEDPQRGGPIEVDAVRFFYIASDDAWVRDHGPLFLTRPQAPELAVVDFGFDAWGGKYPPWDRDAAIARRCAEACGYSHFETDFVLEPGSIDGDGCGTVLTTESCLLNDNRRRPGEPPRTRESVEALLADWLGTRQIIWLGSGIAGDDTDGHVDDFARFIGPGRVVCAAEDDTSDPNFAPLKAAHQTLHAARDATDRRLEVIELPMPPPLHHGAERCPASYANFLLANGMALVPTFGVPTDARALAILGECLEGREIVAIDSRDLVVGLGAVHCVTQQVPASGPADD